MNRRTFLQTANRGRDFAGRPVIDERLWRRENQLADRLFQPPMDEVELRRSVGFKGPIMVEGVKAGANAEETTANARANQEFLQMALASI